MQQIINNIFQDKELQQEALKYATQLSRISDLEFKGGSSCWVGKKCVYNLIFEDLSDIAKLNMPTYKMREEDLYEFRSRQNNRVSYIYSFCIHITDGDINMKEAQVSELDNNIISFTFYID